MPDAAGDEAFGLLIRPMAMLRAGPSSLGPARARLAVLAAVAVCAAAPGTASAAPRAVAAPGVAAAPVGGAVPGEVVVAFERGTTGSERAVARRDAHVTAERQSRLDGVQLVHAAPGESVDEAVARLSRDPNVRYAQPNRWRTAQATTPDDPLFGQLWGLSKIQAPQAWDVFKGVDTVVAVVDEGIEYDHPDLAPNMWTNPDDPPGGGDNDHNGFVDDVHGADFADNDSDPRDIGGHGTHVAGTIAARGNNGLGVIGVNWNARLMAVRVLGPTGGDDLTIAEGFDYAANEGARVVNASLGGPGSSPVLHDAMARHPNTLYVVAAGNAANNNDVTASSPCTENNVNLICVAATTPTDGLANFSNFGATTVDLGAPGTVVLSAALGRTRLSDGFESGAFTDRWNAHVDKGAVAPWGAAAPGAASASAIGDSPNGNYGPNVDSYADLKTPLNLTGASDCVLHFTAKVALGSGDVFAVDRSVNGGAFQREASFSSSVSTGGVYESFEVDLAADNQASVVFGFGLESNGDASVADGVNVDDVSVICAQPPTSASDTAYRFLDGTSMASPHVAGAAALVLGSKPSLTTAQLKSALLDTGDPVASLAGKTLTGKRLNLDKAIRSVNTVTDPGGGGGGTSGTGGGGTTTGGGGTTTTGGGGTTTTLPAGPTLAELAKTARITCARVRRAFRCRVTKAGTTRIRITIRKGARVIARGGGLTGKRITLRGPKAKPGRYTITLTLLRNDEKATVKFRKRIR